MTYLYSGLGLYGRDLGFKVSDLALTFRVITDLVQLFDHGGQCGHFVLVTLNLSVHSLW